MTDESCSRRKSVSRGKQHYLCRVSCTLFTLSFFLLPHNACPSALLYNFHISVHEWRLRMTVHYNCVVCKYVVIITWSWERWSNTVRHANLQHETDLYTSVAWHDSDIYIYTYIYVYIYIYIYTHTHTYKSRIAYLSLVWAVPTTLVHSSDAYSLSDHSSRRWSPTFWPILVRILYRCSSYVCLSPPTTVLSHRMPATAGISVTTVLHRDTKGETPTFLISAETECYACLT